MAVEIEENPKILIIDNDLDHLRILDDVLSEEGYSVTTACDGLEGIKRHRDSSPDLILLDLKMPQINGVETLRRIRGKDKDVAVIILTAFGDSETVRAAANLDVYEHIDKPFELDAIKKTVKEALAAQEKGK